MDLRSLETWFYLLSGPPTKSKKATREDKVVQKSLNTTHVIRVICEEGQASIKVITFYPGRRDRYED
jgi:hypothetical protein